MPCGRKLLAGPLIGDVLSQTGQPLPCADLWLGNAKATSELQQAQIVVQLGSSLTGETAPAMAGKL
ncbi:2-succinyl-5-enolpyruvyl-6-hydroxy-3-cyclohexene-1-carboxylate synthase [Escherichia coli]|uniref:2-succinyl-5-enolpyruvyl-6-hydroxy-3-cyclohexene-1-carboxylate synthase n=1 Tax=Escherichia coli TaxID=562 RepID=A0A376RHE9_ECOLX|nr:2-succinyl-5-enolpyruvyl-6-hydroxy-3-cyclohexene-1-carboxylate synthase [Escherichia coli]